MTTNHPASPATSIAGFEPLQWTTAQGLDPKQFIGRVCLVRGPSGLYNTATMLALATVAAPGGNARSMGFEATGEGVPTIYLDRLLEEPTETTDDACEAVNADARAVANNLFLVAAADVPADECDISELPSQHMILEEARQRGTKLIVVNDLAEFGVHEDVWDLEETAYRLKALLDIGRHKGIGFVLAREATGAIDDDPVYQALGDRIDFVLSTERGARDYEESERQQQSFGDGIAPPLLN